jgi:hypothetical protein
MFILSPVGSSLCFAGDNTTDSPDPPARDLSQANQPEGVDQTNESENAGQTGVVFEDNGWEERLNALGLRLLVDLAGALTGIGG